VFSLTASPKRQRAKPRAQARTSCRIEGYPAGASGPRALSDAEKFRHFSDAFGLNKPFLRLAVARKRPANSPRFMRLLEPDREADVYAIGCELGLTRIGVAADARAPVQPILPGSAPGRLRLRAPVTHQGRTVVADQRRSTTFRGRFSERSRRKRDLDRVAAPEDGPGRLLRKQRVKIRAAAREARLEVLRLGTHPARRSRASMGRGCSESDRRSRYRTPGSVFRGKRSR
jgi:hypothetical protein